MKKAKIYSDAVRHTIESRIPPSIIEAMTKKGWNALGIYELVVEELKNEKRNKNSGRIEGSSNTLGS